MSVIKDRSMETSFNNLSQPEAERLAFLSDQLSQMQQVISKILLHGYESTHPARAATNRQDLSKEAAHVKLALDFLLSKGDVSRDEFEKALKQPEEFICGYLHHHYFATHIKES